MRRKGSNKARLKSKPVAHARFYLLYASVILVSALLAGRAINLQVFEYDFLQDEGNARALRDVPINAYRGVINDRQGETLAMSAPVMAVWVNTKRFVANQTQLVQLAENIGMSTASLQKKLKQHAGKSFVYLKRQLALPDAHRVAALALPGVSLQKEYKRYYPVSRSVSHVVGFTNIDGQGIDGIEMLYNEWLVGESGKKRILKDGKGKIVENIKYLQPPVPGNDLALSIDLRMQHLVYQGLKDSVKRHQAKSASAVILSVKTGEVIAMANYPSYNPNHRSGRIDGRYRNRAVTDEFEPGSTAKPFAVMAALEAKIVTPETVISTSPGYYRVGKKTIRDHRDYGKLDIAGILSHSSNVGVSKLALKMDYSQLYGIFKSSGFGAETGSFFPGEVYGRLPLLAKPHRIERATLAYGYGVTTTTLQLARAYLVLANQGRLLPVTLTLPDAPPKATQVVSASVATMVLGMLEGVVTQGTGTRAKVPGYRVAGKTGTIHKNKHGRYLENQYISLFAGVVPASRPELVMVVMVDNPRPSAGGYYGGLVAAPVFSYVMQRGMRMLNIPPDDIQKGTVISEANAGGAPHNG